MIGARRFGRSTAAAWGSLTMTTRLTRVGGELGVILGPEVLESFGVDENSEVVVSWDDEGIFLRPIRLAPDDRVDDLTGKIMAEHAETLRKLAL